MLAIFGDHRSYRNGDMNSYINSYLNILEKSELTASICHIARFLKSRRKTRRRTQAIAKCYAFHANAVIT